MKKLLPFILIILIFANTSCNNDDDDEPSDCGCNSETIEEITVIDEDNLVATIGYKTQLDPSDDYYVDHFWIGISPENCSYCKDIMIVCNESFLNGQFDYLKDDINERAPINFSGNIKKICKRLTNVADYSYYRIVLTSIEKL